MASDPKRGWLREIDTLERRLAAAEAVVEAARRVAEEEREPEPGPHSGTGSPNCPGCKLAAALAAYDKARGG